MNTATLGKLKDLPLRPTQVEAIDFIRGTNKRFIAVRGPTGVGKTCLGFESIEPPMYYVCSSKQLQEQAASDYPEAAVLMGRNNYYCPRYKTADLCLEEKFCEECDYDNAKSRAIQADRTILNFHYFLTVFNFTTGLGPRNIIIDEADDLESVMTNFISFDFRSSFLDWMGITPVMPTLKTKIEAIEEWIRMKKVEVKGIIDRDHEEMNRIKRACRYRRPNGYEVIKIKKNKALVSFNWKLDILRKENLRDNWIYRYDDKYDKIILKPIWLSRHLMDRFLYSKLNRILFMSATLPAKEVFCGLYGLEADEVAYKDLPSVWDSPRRNIFVESKYNITYKTRDEAVNENIVKSVREVLDAFPGRGLIHTVNFDLAKLISGISDRMISHHNGERKEQFRKFKEKEGAVWVSPSSVRGIDLPYDQCEWIIWLKAPFADLGDPLVTARRYGGGQLGKMWYEGDAAQSIIQGCGRGFRHEDDFCTVFMFDEQIKRLLRDKGRMFPIWFRDLITWK